MDSKRFARLILYMDEVLTSRRAGPTDISLAVEPIRKLLGQAGRIKTIPSASIQLISQ
jgi:hypothetical protein